MRLLEKLRAYGRLVRRPTYSEVPEAARLLARRPGLLVGVAAYETGLLASSRVESRLKALAQVKTGALIGCPF
jgi:hypothetical protein